MYNSEYVSNAYFIIKRSLLTKKQNEFVDTFEPNEQLAKKDYEYITRYNKKRIRHGIKAIHSGVY